MKLLLLILAGLAAVALVACGGGPTQIEKGKLVTGTITASDASVDDWASQPYMVDVLKGVEYFIRLTSPDGNILGVWSADGDDNIVNVDAELTARTSAHTFSESGPQELYIRSPDSDVPSAFTFKIWAPSS